MLVTGTLHCLRITPTELATTPFPIPLITPPVTKMYFIFSSGLFWMERRTRIDRDKFKVKKRAWSMTLGRDSDYYLAEVVTV